LIADPETLMASISARITELSGADRIIILRALSDGALFAVAFNIGYNADGLKDINLTHRDRLAKWLFKNETALVIDKDAGVLQYLTVNKQESKIRDGSLLRHPCARPLDRAITSQRQAGSLTLWRVPAL
jgi:hypothetical protein